MSLLRTGRSTVQKFAVLPVSAMTGIVEVVVGGPMTVEEEAGAEEWVRFLRSTSAVFFCVVGFPPGQAGAVGRRPRIILSLPPIMLSVVASS